MHSGACRPPTSYRIAVPGVAALLLAAAFSVRAQAPVSPPPHAASNTSGKSAEVHAISEEQLRHQLQGKSFYLRGGFFDNDLHFDELGRLIGNAPRVSYTLSMVQIDKVSLSKHKMQLQGIRYGIHFLGASPSEDPLTASDKVRITPKKKVLKIIIDRAEVVKTKKTKLSKEEARRLSAKNAPPQNASQAQASQPLPAQPV